MRAWSAAVGWLAVAACMTFEPVTCPDGRICAPGTACVVVTASGAEPTQQHCIAPDQACDGATPECTLPDGTLGQCHDGACLSVGCGNARLDVGELCDDGNQVPGDGCAGDCMSNEACGNGNVDPIAGEVCDDGNVYSHDGCSSRCTTETPVWTLTRSGVPGPRVLTSMAYDAARDEVVMFAGTRDPDAYPTDYADTWTWDGTAWRLHDVVTGPALRNNHALAYDAARQRVVLFGGIPSLGIEFDDTWLWDGSTWQVVQTSVRPPARSGASLTYDVRRGRLVLFGGLGGSGYLSDTWEWDGTAWSVGQGPGPGQRANHAAAYDHKRGVIVLHGGFCPTGAAACGGVWEYDGTWRHITNATGGPSVRVNHAAAYDPTTGEVMFAGGYPNTNPSTGVWTWNGTQWTVRPSLPAPRARHALIREGVDGGIILFGGTDSATTSALTPSDAMWRWTGTSWTPLALRDLDQSNGAAATYEPARGRVVQFGSLSPGAVTWQLINERWSVLPTTSPPSRTEHGLAHDTKRGETIMFGGETTGPIDETWRFNGASWMLLSPATKPPAGRARMVYDAARDRIVLFGVGPALDQTWLWDGTTWARATPAQQPPGREDHAIGYDPVRARVVVHGGQSTGINATLYTDTWEWDGTTWTEVVAPGPPRRRYPTMTWNPARRRLTMLGGNSFAQSTIVETWEWDGAAWTQVVVPTGPSNRQRVIAVPSPDGTGVVLSSGETDGGGSFVTHNDTWLLSWRDTAPYEECRLGADRDGDGLAGCADPECWAFCTPLCAPGLACDTTAPRCGDGVAVEPLESCASCPADLGACETRCDDLVCQPNESPTTCPGDC